MNYVSQSSQITHPVFLLFQQFLGLLQNDQGSEEANLQLLKQTLDSIIMIANTIGPIDLDQDYPDPENLAYPDFAALARQRFPALGLYNVPLTVASQFMQTELGLHDAVDDLHDIAREVYEILWRFHNTSITDALWCFDFTMHNHMGEHIHSLRWYLFMREYEG